MARLPPEALDDVLELKELPSGMRRRLEVFRKRMDGLSKEMQMDIVFEAAEVFNEYVDTPPSEGWQVPAVAAFVGITEDEVRRRWPQEEDVVDADMGSDDKVDEEATAEVAGEVTDAEATDPAVVLPKEPSKLTLECPECNTPTFTARPDGLFTGDIQAVCPRCGTFCVIEICTDGFARSRALTAFDKLDLALLQVKMVGDDQGAGK